MSLRMLKRMYRAVEKAKPGDQAAAEYIREAIRQRLDRDLPGWDRR
jgi:uncharacterized protein (DUF924 family)